MSFDLPGHHQPGAGQFQDDKALSLSRNRIRVFDTGVVVRKAR